MTAPSYAVVSLVSLNGTSAQVSPADSTVGYDIDVQNTGNRSVNLGTSSVTLTTQYRLEPGKSVHRELGPGEVLYGISTAAGSTVLVTSKATAAGTGGSGGGVAINDSSPSSGTTYSGTKIEAVVATKPSINDGAASSSSTYSGTAIETKLTAATASAVTTATAAIPAAPAMRMLVSGNITSAAAANTESAETSLTPTSGKGLIGIHVIRALYGGTFGSETVTCTVRVTYSDATNSDATPVLLTGTATGGQYITDANKIVLGSDMKKITAVRFTAKSTIASSVATVKLTVLGVED